MIFDKWNLFLVLVLTALSFKSNMLFPKFLNEIKKKLEKLQKSWQKVAKNCVRKPKTYFILKLY